MVNDMRVILIKLAHRLNDMRNIDLAGEKEQIFIDEVKHIYTPIAHRLGLYNVKTELEERVMKHEDLELYNSISQMIRETRKKREVFITEFLRPIERELMAQSIDYEVRWRTKSVPSIYNKMRRQNVAFEEVYDLFAIRIIINAKPKKEKELCWKVYSIVTNIYQPNPKRLRDWITTPKASGYESLHTTVLGMNKKWVEVQIRTRRMDEDAEKGQAAHWQYKGVMNKKDTEDWLSQVRDILENPDQISHDFVYKANGNGQSQRIFVFTPRGDLKQLRLGSTVLDFAFEIHTDVGARCQGARVNNRVVPIRYVLKNGDKVDIITGKNQKPKLDWLAFVKTEKARTNIRKQLKEEKYREAEIGKDMLNRKLKNWKIKSSEDMVNFLVKSYKLDTGTDLYYLIAEEKIDISDVKKRLLDFVDADAARRRGELLTKETKAEEKKETEEDQEIVYIGENLKNVNYRLAKCCNPIRGDNVFGFVTTTGGLTIHRKTCPNAKSLTSKYPYRVLAIKWLLGDEKSYATTSLKITGTDELGLVSAVTRTISDDLRVNMRSINFQKKGRHFEGRVSVLVKDHEHLDQLIAKLNQVKGVEKVVRVK
jgi:GTP pyrophosphokinase